MSEAIRLFVASDSRMGRAERVLEYTARKHTAGDLDITWMRAGDPGWEVGPKSDGSMWNIGRKPGTPYAGRGWATEFTGFRWAVPELAGFEGRAIYMDVDMMVLGDLRQLFEMDLGGAGFASKGGRTCVTLFDASRFALAQEWPSIAQMRREPVKVQVLYSEAKRLVGWAKLPGEWNETGKLTAATRIYHFTDMRTQPWKPYPGQFDYKKRHVCPDAVEEWLEYEVQDWKTRPR